MALKRPGLLAGRIVHGVIALCVSGAVLGLLAFGYGPVPALGRALLVSGIGNTLSFELGGLVAALL